jgi:CheY-like chemotaxis protein
MPSRPAANDGDLIVVVTGDWCHADFRDAIAGLPPSARFLEWKARAELAEHPDLMVLAQSRRLQYDPAQAAEWRGRWPNVPAVHLCSSWCEGEGRSGQTLPGWTRVPWHRWPSDFERFVAARRAGRSSPWDVPSSSDSTPGDERPRLPGGACLHVALATRWASEREVLASLLVELGHSVIAVDGPRDTARVARACDALLVSGDSMDDWVEERLKDSKLAPRDGLKIVVLGFPRRYEVDRARRVGGRATHVLSKPFDVQQLQQLLQTPHLARKA